MTFSLVIQYKVATPETHTNNQNGLSGLYLYIQVYTYMYVTLIIKEKEAIKTLKEGGLGSPWMEGTWNGPKKEKRRE